MSAHLYEMDALPRRGLRRHEYDQLVAAGAFEGERVELLFGELVTMSPQGSAHSWTVRQLARLLREAVADRASLMVQAPICAGDDSEPEPDLAVIPHDEDSPAHHPRRAHLIVEVSETSRARDLGAKATLYASSGFPLYWVVDLERRRVYVHDAPRDGRYEGLTTVDADSGAALALPFADAAPIPVAQVFPSASPPVA